MERNVLWPQLRRRGSMASLACPPTSEVLAGSAKALESEAGPIGNRPKCKPTKAVQHPAKFSLNPFWLKLHRLSQFPFEWLSANTYVPWLPRT